MNTSIPYDIADMPITAPSPFHQRGMWLCQLHVLASYMMIYVQHEGLMDVSKT